MHARVKRTSLGWSSTDLIAQSKSRLPTEPLLTHLVGLEDEEQETDSRRDFPVSPLLWSQHHFLWEAEGAKSVEFLGGI